MLFDTNVILDVLLDGLPGATMYRKPGNDRARKAAGNSQLTTREAPMRWIVPMAVLATAGCWTPIRSLMVQSWGGTVKPATVLLLFALPGGVLAWQVSVPSGAETQVAYPERYRGWTHVKSTLIGPAHRNFATNGGFQHIYANAEAMKGYRTRQFPEGSTIAFDWLEMIEKNGAYLEGPRRRLDVMVKDSTRFATTGGWGFQRFVKDSKTELAAAPTPQQCFACHERLKKDGLVLTSYRP